MAWIQWAVPMLQQSPSPVFTNTFRSRPGHADALGDGQCPAVDAVEAVGVHVVRQAARAADARHEHRLLRPQALVAAQPLEGGQDGVVATAGAPARHALLVVLDLVAARRTRAAGTPSVENVIGLAHATPSLFRTARRTLPGLMGWPRTSRPAVHIDEVARPQEHGQRRVAAVGLVDDGVLGPVAPVRLDRHDLVEALEDLA